jgi:hypothetical protein
MFISKEIIAYAPASEISLKFIITDKTVRYGRSIIGINRDSAPLSEI